MPDNVSSRTRSRMMSAIRGKNTKVELEIRRRLFELGFRYRLYRKDLPGTPDMVFPKYRSVIFVHGCFWHYHGCHLSVVPQTRRLWWTTKLQANADRDALAVAALKRLRWRILIIWECGFRRPKTDRAEALDSVAKLAADFLRSQTEFFEIPEAQCCQKK